MGWYDLSILLNIACVAGLMVVLCSSENRRRLAAWLLASAQANDEIRAAKLAIMAEAKIRRADLEQRFRCGSQLEESESTERQLARRQ
jgi:hypothetical protein